jgi:hypothetical protein
MGPVREPEGVAVVAHVRAQASGYQVVDRRNVELGPDSDVVGPQPVDAPTAPGDGQVGDRVEERVCRARRQTTHH